MKKLLFLLFILFSATANAAITSYYASDTALDENNPTTNYASATSVELSSGDEKMLLQFDISSVDSADIVSAELRIYESLRGESNTLIVSRVLQDINISQATWNIYSTGNNWATAGCSNSTTDYVTTNQASQNNENGGWVIFDVTDLVKDMVDNADYTVAIRASDGSAYEIFYTNEEEEAQDYRPVLYITTGTPGIPTNYYVRVNGGTCGAGNQCDGTADIDYDGEGLNESCACSSLYWASQVANGGDIINVASGEYTITAAATTKGGAEGERTQIIGDSSNPPIFYGNISGDGSVVNLSSHTYFSNFIIRDKNGCIGSIGAAGNIDNEVTQDHISCSGESNTAAYGITMDTGATDVYINNVKIYGMSKKGVQGYALGEIWFVDSEIWGAGFAGWDGDGPEGYDDYTGPLHFSGAKIMYSGCGWRYKATPSGYAADTPHNCYSQDQGGYGDGFGMNGSSGDVTFEDSEASFNVSDGLDFFYGSTNNISIIRSKFEGNAGAAVKSDNETIVENSILIGNCAHWSESEWVYASINAPGRSGSNCNTDGTCDADENWTNCSDDCNAFNVCRPASHVTLRTGLYPGKSSKVINSLLSGNSDVLFSVPCFECNGTETVEAYNNIFIGGTEYNGGESDTTDFFYAYNTGILPTLNEDYNIIAGTKTWDSDCTGEHSVCYESASSVNLAGPIDNTTPDYFDYNSTETYFTSFYLTETSPAIDAANELVTCQDDCSVDLFNCSRGASWDIGAIEYGSTDYCTESSGTVSCTYSGGLTISNLSLQ